jgi:hypothetical protein
MANWYEPTDLMRAQFRGWVEERPPALRTIAALSEDALNKSQRAKGIANGALKRIGA